MIQEYVITIHKMNGDITNICNAYGYYDVIYQLRDLMLHHDDEFMGLEEGFDIAVRKVMED